MSAFICGLFSVHIKLNVGVVMISFRKYVHFAFLFITGCLIIFEESEAAQCAHQGGCYFVCNGQRGDVTHIDLSAIDRQGSPQFQKIKDSERPQYVYDYNPCTTFSEIGPVSCNNVNACQLSNYNEGIGNSVKMSYNDQNMKAYLTYADSGDRKTIVNLVYKSGVKGYIKEVVEDPPKTYTMTLYTKYAPGGSSGGGGGGISTGTVLVIIFFVGLVLYLGIGIGFLRYRRGAQGKDMIPNYEFWSKIPGLAKDGCVFSAKKSKECFETAREKTGKGGEQGEYEKI